MANSTSNDVYDDPDNILADTDDSVDGATELPKSESADLSQSIYTPEKTAPGDDRGPIDELEATDDDNDHDEMTDSHPEDADPDSGHLSNADPADERDNP